MKRCILILTVLVLLILQQFTLQAQGSMFGIRQGASLWLTRAGIGQGTVKYASGQHFTWDEQIFYRHKMKGKWAWETNLAYYKFKNQRTTKQDLPTSERNDIFETSISLQYDVTYPLLGYMFYSMQGMKAYIGFDVSPAIAFNQFKAWDLAGNDHKTSSVTVSMMLGFSYTHIIPISKRINVISRLSFHTNSFSKYQSVAGELRPNKSIGWHTGIGYNL